MNFKSLIASKHVTRVLYVLGSLVILALVFHAGVMVGYHKAKFSFHMGEKYFRAFDDNGRRGDKFFSSGRHGFPDAHGAVGEIVKTELPVVIVLGPDNIEKTILVGSDTKIMEQRAVSSFERLTVGAHIVVIGSPNDSAEITARLIRIMPPQDTPMPTTDAITTTPQ